MSSHVYPIGLSEAPRKFTKQLSLLFSFETIGFLNTAYLDDSYLQDDTYEACLKNVKQTALLLDKVGLPYTQTVSHGTMIPIMEFLGFWLNSVNMTVKLTDRKVQKIVYNDIRGRSTNYQTAQVVGNLVATEPGVPIATMYYKRLEFFQGAAA